MNNGPKILLTGATGYVGGRLRLRLEEQQVPIRCLCRHADYLKARVAATTEVVQGDVLNFEDCRTALTDIDVAFYLVHSMGAEGSFSAVDRRAAENFGKAAKAAGVKRIIYLGGLASESSVSEHMQSRQEVGHILAASGVQTIEFRASIIVGSGSLSFAMIRSLVEHSPIMITPRWVRTMAQPISIRDVLAYLLKAIDIPLEKSQIFEIGGPDQASYRDIMVEYARQRKLRRLIVPVPVLTPYLSSLWLGLVTPLYARIGRKLIDSVRTPSIVEDQSAEKLFQVHPVGLSTAIERALERENRQFAETRWFDALSSAGPEPTWGGVVFGSRIVDSHSATSAASAQELFSTIEQIGGKNGWYFADWAWRLRGLIDLMFGGVGMRRGRRDNLHLLPGDTVDWWRVEAIEPGKMLRLVAEMKVPGRAWLQFEVNSKGALSEVRQTAIFDPIGFLGLSYWYLLYPLHQYIFRGMVRAIAKQAVKN